LVTHINLKTMKTEFRKVMDFLELQQQEDKLNTNQLHLIIQTLTTLLADEQLQEVENLFNYFKK
jgi:archaellum biogenesis ATPase FlaH